MKLTEKLNNAYKVEEVKGGTEGKAVFGIVEKLKNENWSKDNKMQEEACGQLMKLAEMDDKDANKFMEYMDEMSGKYEGYGKKNEAKDAKEFDSEEAAKAEVEAKKLKNVEVVAKGDKWIISIVSL